MVLGIAGLEDDRSISKNFSIYGKCGLNWRNKMESETVNPCFYELKTVLQKRKM